MALGQGAIAGVGEGTSGGWHGHTWSPGTLELGMAGCGRRVVWGRGRRQRWVEASYSFRLCEHAIHGRAAVYATSSHLAQSHDWALISKPFIREEFIGVLKKMDIYISNDCVSTRTEQQQNPDFNHVKSPPQLTCSSSVAASASPNSLSTRSCSS